MGLGAAASAAAAAAAFGASLRAFQDRIYSETKHRHYRRHICFGCYR
jgi:hypothetical protein